MRHPKLIADRKTPAWKIKDMRLQWASGEDPVNIAKSLDVGEATVRRYCSDMPRKNKRPLPVHVVTELIRRWPPCQQMS